MPKLKTITASLTVTKGLPNYSNIKPGVEEVWELQDEDQDNIEEIRKSIWKGVERQIEEQLG